MLAQYEEKMKKTIESLEKEYSTIRAGRANPHILDRFTIAAGGKYHSSRSKNDYDLTLGVKPDQRDREGDCMF